MGQLLGGLQQLQQKDPDKLGDVLTQIATQLRDASQQGSGGSFLLRLADRFQEAADTGDLSALRPPRPKGNRVERAYAAAAQSEGVDPKALLSSVLGQVKEAGL